MAKASKRVRAFQEKVETGKPYAFDEVVSFLKEFASKNFAETVEVSVKLGIDPRKSDQAVRGATTLPKGSGKKVRVAVFAQGDNAEAAKAAGADEVGMDDLAEKMKGGDIDFGVVIATPDAMRVVGALGQVLGPRGLMPNPKPAQLHQLQLLRYKMPSLVRFVTAPTRTALFMAALAK